MTPNRESAVDRGPFRAAASADDADDLSDPASAETDATEPAPATGAPATLVDGGSDLPLWFHLAVVSAAVLVATTGSFGLLLGINGAYRTWLVLAVAVPLTALLVVGLLPGRARTTVTRAGQVGAVLALTIAVGYAAFAGATPSQHVLLNRDPGAYELAGRWLSESGSIDIDAKGTAFEGIDGLLYKGAAIYNVPEVPLDAQGKPVAAPSGQLQMQFNHLSSAVLAASYDVGGSRLLFRTPAILGALGLLLIYAVASRATRRPLLSLAAPLVLAVSMPLLYISRDTFSEPFALVLLWGGLLVLLDAHERPRPWVGIVGGVLLGAVAGARVDALVYVILLFPLAAVSIAAARRGRMRRSRLITWTIAVVTTALVSTIGWIDLTRHAGSYAHDLRPDIDRLLHTLVASIVVSVVGLAVWLLAPPLRRVARRVQRPGAWLAAGLVVATLLGLWLVRPMVQEVRVVAHGVDDSGDPDARRSRRRAPLLCRGQPALDGLVPRGAGAHRRDRRPRDRRVEDGSGPRDGRDRGGRCAHDRRRRRVLVGSEHHAFPAVGESPLHPCGLPRADRDGRGRPGRARRPPDRPTAGPALRWLVGAVLLAALVVPAAVTTWPVRWQRNQGGFLEPVSETCRGMQGNPAVIMLGNYESLTLQQTLRSWCGVPVAAQGSALDGPEAAHRIAATLKERGYDLYLVTEDGRTMQSWATAAGGTPQHSVGVRDSHTVEETLVEPPDEYARPREALPLTGPFHLYWLRVDPATG